MLREMEQQLEVAQRRHKYLMARYLEEREAFEREKERRLQAERRISQLQQQLLNNQCCDGHSILTRGASEQNLRDTLTNTTTVRSSRSHSNLAEADSHTTTLVKQRTRNRWKTNENDENIRGIRLEVPQQREPMRRIKREPADRPILAHIDSTRPQASLSYFVYVDGTPAWRAPPGLQAAQYRNKRPQIRLSLSLSDLGFKAVLHTYNASFIRRSHQRQARIKEASLNRAQIAERKRAAARKVLDRKIETDVALPLLQLDAGRVSAMMSTPRTMARDTRRRLHKSNEVQICSKKSVNKEDEDRRVNRLLAYCYSQKIRADRTIHAARH